MPTGYTAKLVEKGEDFQSFVMRCARAFGALIMMRDEDMEAPIPEEFQPSPYYTEALAKARKDLAEFEALSQGQKEERARKAISESIRRAEASLAKARLENARIAAMVKQVEAWEPPSEDHQELKNFMRQQLEVSGNDESYLKRGLKPQSISGWIAETHGQLIKAIPHYENLEREERERQASRTKWVRDLRASLVKLTGKEKVN